MKLEKGAEIVQLLKTFASEYDYDVLLCIRDKATGSFSQLTTNTNSFTIDKVSKLLGTASSSKAVSMISADIQIEKNELNAEVSQ